MRNIQADCRAAAAMLREGMAIIESQGWWDGVKPTIVTDGGETTARQCLVTSLRMQEECDPWVYAEVLRELMDVIAEQFPAWEWPNNRTYLPDFNDAHDRDTVLTVMDKAAVRLEEQAGA